MAIQSKNLYDDNEDIKFHIEKMIDWDTIVPLRERDFEDYKKYQETEDERYALAFGDVEEGVELYKSLLEGIGEISAKEFMKNAPIIDKEGFKFENGKVIFPEAMKRNIQLYVENGYAGVFLPRQYGGMNIPNIVNVMLAEIVAAGDIGFVTLIATQDLGDIINKFGSEEQKQKYLPKLAAGEIGAAMLLTEPNYGSDLQNAQTKGEVKDGVCYVTGVKQFITHGVPHSEGGSVYLTVVRTVKRPDGTYREGGAGLSLVLVHSDHCEITSLEHKLGIHSSPTVQITMENAPGEIVGEEGKGLVEYTMALMNAARLGVGAQALGVSEIAYREAWKYANERVQFGVLIKDIPAVGKMLEEMRLSLEASRALTYETAQVVDIKEGLEFKYQKEGMTAKQMRKQKDYIKWSKLAKVLTPFTKLYTSEECNRNAYKAIQVHGGVGYSEEYDVARIYRDARITSIYEGTSQLQVVAAIVGVLEGYGRDNSELLAYQKEMRDSLTLSDDLKPYLERVIESEQMLKEAIPEFKKYSEEFKKAYAFDIVWSATMIFISHLFLKMAMKDDSGDKATKAKKYINETYSYVLVTLRKIELQSQV